MKPLPLSYSPQQIISDLEFRNLPTYFMAMEESDFCSRSCFGPSRAFLMHIKDGTGLDVLRINRPFKCTLPCGFPPLCGTYCAPEEADIYSMAPGGFQGPLLARVIRSPGCQCCSLENVFHLLDANGALAYIVAGNAFQFGPNCCCTTVSYDILEPSGTPTGAHIRNLFPGCARACGKADNLSVTFPPNATAEHRAGLFGLTLLLDYVLFEKRGSGSNAGQVV